MVRGLAPRLLGPSRDSSTQPTGPALSSQLLGNSESRPGVLTVRKPCAKPLVPSHWVSLMDGSVLSLTGRVTPCGPQTRPCAAFMS